MAEVAETKFITNFFLGSAAGITLLIILFSILLCPFHLKSLALIIVMVSARPRQARVLNQRL